VRDIVIPYLKNGTGELETCIALIEKNVPHRNIFVIEDFRNTKYANISHINQILKLEWALDNLDLTEDFYLFNDDFFVIDPIKDIPYMHKGKLSDHIKSRISGRGGAGDYFKALKVTNEMLSRSIKEPLSYELHMPFLFKRDELEFTISTLQKEIEKGVCPLIRSWYGNMHNVGGAKTEDVKNIPDYEGRTFLSTSNKTFKGEIGGYIRSKI
jgi:hypothetical protein